MITFAPLELERDDLLVLAVLNDFGGNLGAIKRRPMTDAITISIHQHVVEGCGLSGFDLEQIDIHRVAFRDAVLPSACSDNCVSHKREVLRGKSRAKFHITAGLTRGNVVALYRPAP